MTTIRLTPHGEELLKKELAQHPEETPEQVIERALKAIQRGDAGSADSATQAACQEAAARIRELRKGVTLGGLKIKDLIHEGQKRRLTRSFLEAPVDEHT